jgi:hypothetical protein
MCYFTQINRIISEIEIFNLHKFTAYRIQIFKKRASPDHSASRCGKTGKETAEFLPSAFQCLLQKIIKMINQGKRIQLCY